MNQSSKPLNATEPMEKVAEILGRAAADLIEQGKDAPLDDQMAYVVASSLVAGQMLIVKLKAAQVKR